MVFGLGRARAARARNETPPPGGLSVSSCSSGCLILLIWLQCLSDPAARGFAEHSPLGPALPQGSSRQWLPAAAQACGRSGRAAGPALLRTRRLEISCAPLRSVAGTAAY